MVKGQDLSHSFSWPERFESAASTETMRGVTQASTTAPRANLFENAGRQATAAQWRGMWVATGGYCILCIDLGRPF